MDDGRRIDIMRITNHDILKPSKSLNETYKSLNSLQKMFFISYLNQHIVITREIFNPKEIGGRYTDIWNIPFESFKQGKFHHIYIKFNDGSKLIMLDDMEYFEKDDFVPFTETQKCKIMIGFDINQILYRLD